MSSGADTLAETRDVPRGTVRKRRLARDASASLTVLALLLAIAIIISLVVVAGYALGDAATPALFRAAPLMFNGFFATVVLSVYVDQELFDFRTAFVAGGLALAADIPLLIYELRRWAACAGVGGASQTPLENSVCNNFASQANVVPIVSLVVFVLTLATFIILFFWHAQRRAFLLARERIRLRNAQRSFETDRQIMRGVQTRRLANLRALLRKARRNGYRVATMALSVAQLLLVVLFVGVLALVFPNAGAFYRAAFLLVPAHAAAAEFAFFGTTPRGWTWLVLAFSLLALLTSVWGAVLELPRFFRCTSATAVPIGVVETSICNDEGFLGYVVPWVLLLSAIMSLATSILSVLMIVRGTAAVEVRPRA